MIFTDEPAPGDPLPILPGHSSPGRFERVLRAGAFAVTAELSPPDSADPEEVYARARVFDGRVDAINATDGSGANCHMSSVAVCALLTRVGYSPVLQISCRDRNRIAIQGDILGAAAMGVANLLCLTGDGVQAGDHPQAKPVFDLDCLSLMEIARRLREEGRFESGRALTDRPKMFLGAAENPFTPPYDYRPLHLAKKIAAGAQFIQTQYCYDMPLLRQFLTRVDDLGLARSRVHPGRRGTAAVRKNGRVAPAPRRGRAHSRCGGGAPRRRRQAEGGRAQSLHRAHPGNPRDQGRERRPRDGLPPRGGGGRSDRRLRRAHRSHPLVPRET